MRRPLPPTYLLAAIALIVAMHFLLPLANVLPFPWVLVGVPPLVAGVAVNLAADQAFKNRKTTVKPFEVSSALVTDGVFRVSRNPMYLGFVLVLLGLALFLGSLSPFVVVAIFPILMDGIFIRVEERMLHETFGEEWVAYRSRVRKWIGTRP